MPLWVGCHYLRAGRCPQASLGAAVALNLAAHRSQHTTSSSSSSSYTRRGKAGMVVVVVVVVLLPAVLRP